MAGHIKRRESARTGAVTYQARLPHPTLKNKDIVKTFEKSKDARRWLEEQRALLLRGEFIDPTASAKPFSELVATWERTRVAKLAPRTRERYASITRSYLVPAFGATAVGRLDRATIKEWFAARAEERKPTGDQRYTPATLRKIQIVLSSILGEGVELGLIRVNPAARLRLATPPRREMTVLTAAEVRALAEAVDRPADRLAVYTAAYTGLRAGELWALRTRDLDLAGRRLIVGRTLTSESGRLVFRTATKTTGSRRVVSLPAFLANMFASQQAGSDPDALVFTAPGGANGRPEGDGGPVRHELFVRRVFKPAVRATLPAGKANLRWHDLRHTCAALLIAAGRHPLEIKTRLGHASITTTMDRYGWLFPSAEEALADVLDAAHDEASNVSLLDNETGTGASVRIAS